MTWSDLSRRAATVFLVALCVLAVPAIANAKFTGSQAASQQVGTASMSTPSNVLAYYTCTRSGSTESIRVSVMSFGDSGPSGSTYNYRLATGSTTRDTAATTAKNTTLDGSKSADSVATTWTVTISAKLQRWTGGTATDSVSCPASGTKSGWM